MKIIFLLIFMLNARAINLQKFHFSNNPVFATLEDGLLSDGFITNDYKYILVGSYNYVKSPFIIVEDGNRKASIIEWMHTFNVGGAYKFNKNLQLGISTFFTFQNSERVGLSEHEKDFSPGDSTIDLKWKFYEKDRFAIAFTPRLYLPTGESDFYTSNDKLGYYLGFAFDKAFKSFQIALNLGHKENRGAAYQTLSHEKQFHLSVGALIPLLGPWDLTAEFYKDTPYDSENIQSPSELNAGFRYTNSEDSAYFAGIGTGSLFDEENSIDMRLYAGFKYFPSERKKSKTVKKEEKKFGHFYKLYNVYFETGRHEITASEKLKLDEMIKHLKNDNYISKIVIEGYTSKIGSVELNKMLSTKRAENVTNYLVRRGVPLDILEKVSYGDLKADIENKNKVQDRKVMFRIYRKK